MDGDKKIGLRLIGNRGACFKRDEGVIVAGVNDICAEALPEQLAQAKRYIEHNVFLFDSTRAQRAGIMSSMSGVYNDAADFEAESTHHRTLSGSGRSGFMDRRSICIHHACGFAAFL